MNHIILPGLIIPKKIILIDDLQIIIPELIIPEEIIYIKNIEIKKIHIEIESEMDDIELILTKQYVDVKELFYIDDYFSTPKKQPSYLFKPTRNILKEGFNWKK